MKKLILIPLFITFISNIFCQNLGVGNVSTNSSAILDVSSTNKGFLPPRVSLTSTNDVTTILSPATGLVVYNLATAGVSPTNVIPSYYYFTGTLWLRISDAGNSNGDIKYWNGVQWVLLPAGANGQTLSFCNGGPTWGPCVPSTIICNKVWMSKNLDVNTYRNGDTIRQVINSSEWDTLSTGAWCYYNNDSTLGAIYGKLYNGYAVADPRGLAPLGWHVSSTSDWSAMAYCLGGFDLAGGAMKEAGFSHWQIPNFGATNSSNFNGLPGGIRYDNLMGMYGLGIIGSWWTSNMDMFGAFTFSLNYNSSKISFDDIPTFIRNGLSVRCVRD